MQKDLLDITAEELQTIQPTGCININVGILGHVDSGKTSICRMLTTVASTASLDKNPQSQERGITLDLGFSAFFTKTPERFEVKQPYLQFTLVDCPGHASLIRTVIGGVQIIDLTLLIIDITKGIQTQTAECIIIAELFTSKLLVVLNKVDLLEDHKMLEAKMVALRKVFAKTKFGAEVLMVPHSTKSEEQIYSRRLKEMLLDHLELPKRDANGKFLYLIDHCFKIKGKGTVATGTVIEGRAKPGDEIQFCELQQKFKIKSMQMFRKPIQVARQGDRVAMLMHHLEAQLIERGVACTPGYLNRVKRVIIDLHLVRLYKRSIKNKARFNFMSGHQTVEGELRMFICEGQFSKDKSYLAINVVDEENVKQLRDKIFALVTFQHDFYTKLDSKLIGFKPDIDNDEKACRIAFNGSVKEIFEQEDQLKLHKEKVKRGAVDRVVDNYSLIAKDLFEKDANVQTFIGKEVLIEALNISGKIEGSFGKSGKVRIMFQQPLVGVQQGMQLLLKFSKQA